MITLPAGSMRTRGKSAQLALAPLRAGMHEVAYTPKPLAYNHLFIVGVHDGSPPADHPRAWRFATSFHGIFGCYYEEWEEKELGEWLLRRAYLSLLVSPQWRGVDETELLALHCDPSLPLTETNRLYRIGPHLHLKAAGEPFDKAHLGLCMTHLDAVLESAESLTQALKVAIQMLADEILARSGGEPFTV